MEEYINAFNKLIFKSGHTNGFTIIVLFQKGLNTGIQNQVATMQVWPMWDDYKAWCSTVRLFNQDRLTNLPFNASLGQNVMLTVAKLATASVMPISCVPVILPLSTHFSVYPFYQAPSYLPPRPTTTFMPSLLFPLWLHWSCYLQMSPSIWHSFYSTGWDWWSCKTTPCSKKCHQSSS